MAKTFAIVRGVQAEHAGVLFMMDVTDFRFGVTYIPVTRGRRTKDRETAYNGMRVSVFLGDDGKKYHVFSDYSVRAA